MPHTERLGPVDYLQCINMNVVGKDPSHDTSRSIKRAMEFVLRFESSGCVITLEVGSALEGALPGGDMETLSSYLTEHEAVVSGHKSKSDAMDSLFGSNEREEIRHTGSLGGEMKNTEKKLKPLWKVRIAA